MYFFNKKGKCIIYTCLKYLLIHFQKMNIFIFYSVELTSST